MNTQEVAQDLSSPGYKLYEKLRAAMFAGAHIKLGLEREHFEHWLGLWELNNNRSLPPREAEEMNALAHRLGERLFTVTQAYR